VRDLARRVLQGQGYTLLEAQDAQEALLLSTRYSGPIHLLLTDVVMPGTSGKALAEQMSQTHPDMKLLFMSGYTDHAITHYGELDPGITLLQKPFSPVTLTRKVREVLDAF
jgi:DNA-binding NtrC family response regulator